MGSIYLPGTINTPKKEIIRYEGGYIRTIYGICIGRYDDKYVYEGDAPFNNHHIGTIEFNYGYLRSSRNILVKAYNDGSLSFGNSRYFAYFDGDMAGAIAAFILCYKKGMLEIPSTSAYASPPSNTVKKSNESGCSSATVGSGGSDGSTGCLAVIAIIVFFGCAVYAGFSVWSALFGEIFTGEASFMDNWGALIPIVAIIIAECCINSKGFSASEIFGVYATVFLITIILSGILLAIAGNNLVWLFIGPLGVLVISIPPFVIAVILSIVIKKLK